MAEIMKHMAGFFAAILLAFHPHHGHGQTISGGFQGGGPSGGSGGGAGCSAFPVDGGCAASPGGNFQVAVNTLVQSGQTWTSSHPWNWNSCGIDYKCGYYTATASLTRADQINSVASACTYSGTGNGASGPLITCTATTNLNITGVDFTNAGSGTGTTCVALDIKSGQSGTITIKNNKFDASVLSGTNACTQNTNPCCGLGTYVVLFENSSTAGLDVESNNVDCGGTSVGGGVGQCFFVFAGVNSAVTIKYNVMLHANSPDFIFGATSTYPTSIVSQYNYAGGWIYSPPGYHGEFYQIGGGSASGTITTLSTSYDTLFTDHLQYVNGTSGNLWFPLGGTPSSGNFITQATIDHDVLVTNTTSNGTDPCGTCTSGGLGRLGSATYTHINLTNNYLDLTGINGGSNAWVMDSAGVCTNPATISGNTILTSPGGSGHNAWDSNSGSGC